MINWVEAYREAVEAEHKAWERLDRIKNIARRRARPSRPLRKATPDDVVEGNVLWSAEEYEGELVDFHFHIVYEVWNKNSEWNGFSDNWGNNYGIHSMWVEAYT